MAPLLECFICQNLEIVPSTASAKGQEKNGLGNGLAAREFQDHEAVRQHVIASHPKIVARAFFYPNGETPLHIWLLSCVDWSTNSVTAEESSSTSSSSDSPDSIEPAQEDEPKDAETAEETLDWDAMLMQLLGNNKSNDEKEKPGAVCRKRSSCHSDSVSAPKKVKEEPPENGRVSPVSHHPNGLVDSKAKNKVTCQMCKIEVCNTARQRHVFMVHVNKADMYKCPQCDYVNSNSIWEAKKHTTQHGKKVEPISNEDKYKNSIMMWNRKCFPEWKQKRPSWWTGNDEETVTALGEAEDCTELIRSQIVKTSSPEPPPSPAAPVDRELTDLLKELSGYSEEESIVKDEDRSDQPPRAPPEGLVIDERTCNLCWEESRYPGRHIAQKHLKRPLYECPVCRDKCFGSYESCTVMKHIHKMHPEETDAQPINNLDLYADEIRDLQNRCFPNRPMKLVRSRDSTRPRERHNCMLCKAQVAQSDRQRHVYHRHLQANRIFECPLCSFSSNYDVHRVKWHIKWMHKDDPSLEPISHENSHRQEIDELNEKCFPGWQHRRRPFWWLDNSERARIDEENAENVDEGGEEEQPSPERKDEGDENVAEVKTTQTKRLSEWTCRLCLKEFKPTSNFLRHVAKDHLDIPLFACPLCDDGGSSESYEVKTHLVKVHQAADFEPIANLETNAEHVQQKFHECFPNRKMKPGLFEKKREVVVVDESKVTCQECFQEMKTEDRQIHVYRHHLKQTRLYECPLCDFSHHACSSDVRAHIKYTHRDQPDLLPKANLLQHSEAIADWNERCFPGWINRKLPASAMEDFNRCRLCDEEVRQTSRHIAETHLRIQLHVCPLCDYGAPEARLVKRHMKNHHDEDDLEPIANVVARRADFSALHDKCFPGRPKRLSNITISDEGRRTKCKICSAAVSRKKRLSHTLEKHLQKTGYGCSLCDFTHDFDDTVVQQHIKSSHSSKKAVVLCLALKFFEEVQSIGLICFPDWVMDPSQM